MDLPALGEWVGYNMTWLPDDHPRAALVATYYLDTSALAKRYLREPRSDAVDDFLSRLESVSISRLTIQTLILAALWIALSRAGFAGNQRLRIWLAVALPFTAWLVVVWWIAFTGGFRVRPGVPSIPAAIFIPVILGLIILLRSKRIAAALDAIPSSWLVGLQLYRVLGGIFLVAWLQGALRRDTVGPAVGSLAAADTCTRRTRSVVNA